MWKSGKKRAAVRESGSTGLVEEKGLFSTSLKGDPFFHTPCKFFHGKSGKKGESRAVSFLS